MRSEHGYLGETGGDQIAATRMPSDQPLTYRLRVRVPESADTSPGSRPARFRVVYSSIWPADESNPRWYGAVPILAGESTVTLRIMRDPRDDRWKIAVIAQSEKQTKRMATTLSPKQIEVFRGSHDVISTGIPRRKTSTAICDQPMRVLDERWLVGEGSLMLYGDTGPREDQIGVYAELQPDRGPL